MKHIFIVDDDIHIGNMLEEVLQREGYKVSRAYSGTEALLVLSTQTPDLILLDLMLPGLNGEEVLPKIQGIPVIILSARSETDHKVQLLLDGACDYITKPFDLPEFGADYRSASKYFPAPCCASHTHISGNQTEYRNSPCIGSETSCKIDKDRICHSKTSDGTPLTSHDQISFTGANQRRYS